MYRLFRTTIGKRIAANWCKCNWISSQAPFFHSCKEGLYKNLNCVYGGLEDVQLIKNAFEMNNIDTVFHLAAQAITGDALQNPVSTFETNIRGTWNLLESLPSKRSKKYHRAHIECKKSLVGFISRLQCMETFPLQGRYPYDVSKSCADLITHSYYFTYDLPVCTIRFGNLFGGGDLNFSRIIPYTIKSVFQNQAPVIHSAGTFKRDFFYIEDAVRAHFTL